MKLGTMLGDIVSSAFTRPATRRYPFERVEAPATFHGKLVWKPASCNGCQLCVKDCPTDAIEIITEDKAAKRYVMRYHADRCTYCAQCVQNCRLQCLGMSHDQWENAGFKRSDFVVHYGNEADIAHILATFGQPGAEPAAGRAND